MFNLLPLSCGDKTARVIFKAKCMTAKQEKRSETLKTLLVKV